MKKKLALMMALVLAMSIMLPLVSAFAVGGILGPQWVYASNGKPVNLRALPNTDCEILTRIPVGTKLTNCKYYNNTWTLVSYGSYDGYMMTKFLMSREPPRPVPTPKPTAKPTAKPTPAKSIYASMMQVNYYVVVAPSNSATFANLRWAPSLDVPVMCIYYPGYQLRALQTNGEWTQVFDEASGLCGWVKNFLIQPIAVGASGAGNQAQ